MCTEAEALLKGVDQRINKVRSNMLVSGLTVGGIGLLANQPLLVLGTYLGIAGWSAYKHAQLHDWFQSEQEALVRKHAGVFAAKLGTNENRVLTDYAVNLRTGYFHFTRKQVSQK